MMNTRIAGLATALALLVTTTAEAGTVAWPFQGCEAADIAALATTPDANTPDTTTWTGDSHSMGPWTLRHAADLDCQDGDCRARLTLTIDHAGTLLAAEPLAAPLTLTARGGHLGQSLSLGGEAARSLHDNLGEAAFDQDGVIKRVLMDSGTLADAVLVRIRTEIACTPVARSCTVVADPIAYIAYDDRTRCGSLPCTLSVTN